MVVLLTYGLCPRKKPVSHLTSAARLACSVVRVLRSALVLVLRQSDPLGSLSCLYPTGVVVLSVVPSVM
jgi:hypothetical protein